MHVPTEQSSSSEPVQSNSSPDEQFDSCRGINFSCMLANNHIAQSPCTKTLSKQPDQQSNPTVSLSIKHGYGQTSSQCLDHPGEQSSGLSGQLHDQLSKVNPTSGLDEHYQSSSKCFSNLREQSSDLSEQPKQISPTISLGKHDQNSNLSSSQPSKQQSSDLSGQLPQPVFQ